MFDKLRHQDYVVEIIQEGDNLKVKEVIHFLFNQYRSLANSMMSSRLTGAETRKSILLETIHDFIIAVKDGRFQPTDKNKGMDKYIRGILDKKWKEFLKEIYKKDKKEEAARNLNQRHNLPPEGNSLINPMDSRLEKMLLALKKLQELNPVYAYILHQFWLEGKSLQEIAGDLEKSYQNTRKLHERAKKKLKALYDAQASDNESNQK